MRRSLPATKAQSPQQDEWLEPVDVPTIRPPDGKRYLLAYIILLALWVAVSWPAFTERWWHADDYTRAISFDYWFSVGQGRPLEILVPYLLTWDQTLQSLLFQQSVRLLQVALHVLTAILIIRLFAKLVPWHQALFAVLFFLFWPFHAEAVVWLSAFAYPWAAALSLWGLLFISAPRRRWFGTLMIVCAMFTNQSAAVAALVAWVIYQALFVIQQDRLKVDWHLEAFWLALSYIISGLLSRLMIVWVLRDTGRATLTNNIYEKVFFWLELNRQYVASPHYPWPLTILTVALPVVVMLLALNAWRRHHWSWRQLGATALVFALLTLLPYAIVMLTAESSPAWRILYLAPLLSVAAWLVAQELLKLYPLPSYLTGGILLLFLAIVLPMNRWNAADYVAVSRQDMAQLKTIEAAAAAHQPPLHHLIVATYPEYLRAWQLYDVTYMHYDSKKSAFLRDWTVVPLIEEFSTLEPWPMAGYPLRQDPPYRQACVAICMADDAMQPWQLHPLPDGETICVCP